MAVDILEPLDKKRFRLSQQKLQQDNKKYCIHSDI